MTIQSHVTYSPQKLRLPQVFLSPGQSTEDWRYYWWQRQALVNIDIKSTLSRYITLTNKFHKTVNPPRPPPHWFFESLFLSLSYRFLPAFCEEKKHRGMKTS